MMTTDIRKMTPAQLRARVLQLEAGLQQWEQAKERMLAKLAETDAEDAETPVAQAERLLRSQRYGPDSEVGQVAVNALTLVTIIAATALIATIGAHALAAWLASIVTALTT